jgi:hypothetical protein
LTWFALSPRADFSDVTVSPTVVNGRYFVVVKMFWFQGNGSMEGKASRKIRNYRRRTASDAGAIESYCLSGYA